MSVPSLEFATQFITQANDTVILRAMLSYPFATGSFIPDLTLSPAAQEYLAHIYGENRYDDYLKRVSEISDAACAEAVQQEVESQPKPFSFSIQSAWTQCYDFVTQKLGIGYYKGNSKSSGATAAAGVTSTNQVLDKEMAETLQKKIEQAKATEAKVLAERKITIEKEKQAKSQLNLQPQGKQNSNSSIPVAECNRRMLEVALNHKPTYNYGMVSALKQFGNFMLQQLPFMSNSTQQPVVKPTGMAAIEACADSTQTFKESVRKLHNAQNSHQACLERMGYSPLVSELALRLESCNIEYSSLAVYQRLEDSIEGRYCFRNMDPRMPCYDQFMKLHQKFRNTFDGQSAQKQNCPTSAPSHAH